MAESEYESRFEVWSNPGGLLWKGPDQEEAILEYLRLKKQYGGGRSFEVLEYVGVTYRPIAPRSWK